MKKFVNFVRQGLHKARKVVAAVAAVAVSVFASAEARATDIVTVNETTGAVTWDISPLITGIIAALALAIGSVIGIMLIRKGWGILRSYFMRS